MSRPDDEGTMLDGEAALVIQHLADAGCRDEFIGRIRQRLAGEGRMSTDRPIKTRAEFVSFVLASMNAIGDMISPREAGDAFVKALDEYERLESGDPGVAVAPPTLVQDDPYHKIAELESYIIELKKGSPGYSVEDLAHWFGAHKQSFVNKEK